MSKYKNGDKVRVIEDVRFCKTIKKGDIVEIDRVEFGFQYYIKGHNFKDGSQYYLNDDEFELVEEPSDKRYVWYLDSEDETYFLCFDGAVYKYNSPANEDLKKGKHISFLLTEEEARKSPFFDKFKKHDPFEKWYYIRMKGNDEDYLNLNFDDDSYFMDDEDEYGTHKTKFTKKECDEIVGTSSILYKEEC
ncbi:hypothetical protein [Kurthia gibsonii]|uniref:hypothetical protein n=1 Tax=Kurthia gibsonii TaxID=33946 RepID=UPI00301A56B1